MFLEEAIREKFNRYIKGYIERYPYLKYAKIEFGRITNIKPIDSWGEKLLEGHLWVMGRMEKFAVSLFREEDFYVQNTAGELADLAVGKAFERLTENKNCVTMGKTKLYLNKNVEIPDFAKLNGFIILNAYLERLPSIGTKVIDILVQTHKKKLNRRYFVLFTTEKEKLKQYGYTPIGYIYNQRYIPDEIYIYNVKLRDMETVMEEIKNTKKVKKIYYTKKEYYGEVNLEEEKFKSALFRILSNRKEVPDREKEIILKHSYVDCGFLGTGHVNITIRIIETNDIVDTHNEVAGGPYWDGIEKTVYKENVTLIKERYVHDCNGHRDGYWYQYALEEDKEIGYVLLVKFFRDYAVSVTQDCIIELYRITNKDGNNNK